MMKVGDEMNDRFLELKREYDNISVEIRKLYNKQREIRDKMAKECTHENLDSVESDPLLVAMGIEDNSEYEKRYKCRDCFEYVTEEEIKEMR